MADKSEKSLSDEWQWESVLEKGEINNNSEMVDYNENKDDPQVLEAILASLNDAKKANDEPDPEDKLELRETSSECDNVAIRESEETVEITKMDLRVEEVDEVLDHFSKSSSSSSCNKASQEKRSNSDKKAIKRKMTSRPNKSTAANKVKESFSESFSDEGNDCNLPSGDTDYKPGKKDDSKVTPRRAKRANTKKAKNEYIHFDCGHCTFQSEILGELKLHQHTDHEEEGCAPPSYLDMAEAAIAKLGDRSGVEELTILKEVLFDHFDSIAEDKSRASQLLCQALRGGVKLGRLKVNRRGKGNERYWLVTKERMKLVVDKWRKYNKSVEFVDSPGKAKLSKARRVKNKIKIKSEIEKVAPEAMDDSGSDIAILDESLTDKTKLRLMRKKFSISNVPAQRAQTSLSQSKIVSPPSPPCPDMDTDEDDPTSLLTCPVCFFSFWYENQTVEHMNECHPHDARVKKYERASVSKVEVKTSVPHQDQSTGGDDLSLGGGEMTQTKAEGMDKASSE